MSKVEKLLAKIAESPKNIRYEELYSVCQEHFGIPRQTGSSHAVFSTPWPGDPRVNIQEGDGGKAKAYQVRQVLAAIDKLRQMEPEEGA
ncbi:toxin HicA [Nocardia sp. NPDC059180]|uniref:toxin HicA n=1 Tax=Nocardia sp. NPDC059180 TaxID=3346761 RepID=UPI0036AB3DEE